MPDLHAEFVRPSASTARDRSAFLRAVDELPGLRPVRAAMRRVVPATGTLVDAGCGVGLETTRLATDHPDLSVIGLDVDHDLVAGARDGARLLGNLSWRVGDVCALDLAPASIDVVRTERVLMYVPSLDEAAASIRAVLRRGGVMTGFELDYGATVLPPVGLAPAEVRTLCARLEAALPQPWAGRMLPEALHAAGMTVTDVEPYAFAVDAAVFSRIVAGTVGAPDAAGGPPDAARVESWLHAVDRHAFRAVFTGVLTTARRP